jgi:hypothetical protein
VGAAPGFRGVGVRVRDPIPHPRSLPGGGQAGSPGSPLRGRLAEATVAAGGGRRGHFAVVVPSAAGAGGAGWWRSGSASGWAL